MKSLADKGLWGFLLLLFLDVTLICPAFGNTRTLEVPFALSADPSSEFVTQFRVLSPGRLVVEVSTNSHQAEASQLVLVLLRPDRSDAVRKQFVSPPRLEYRITESEVDRFIQQRQTQWSVKVLNDGTQERREVRGVLRITVPATAWLLMDTQFTLLGSGNAQEIPFTVPGAGRIQVETSWESDPISTGGGGPVPLTLSVNHPGLVKTFARRQGNGPLKAEHQASDVELDAGNRWLGRIQNDSQSKVKGRFQVTFTPAL